MLKVSQGAVTVVRGVLIGLALLAGWLGAIGAVVFAVAHLVWIAPITLVVIFVTTGIHIARWMSKPRALGSQNDG